MFLLKAKLVKYFSGTTAHMCSYLRHEQQSHPDKFFLVYENIFK